MPHSMPLAFPASLEDTVCKICWTGERAGECLLPVTSLKLAVNSNKLTAQVEFSEQLVVIVRRWQVLPGRNFELIYARGCPS